MSKNKGGRPTKYNKKILVALQEYGTEGPTETVMRDVATKNGVIKAVEEVNNKLPTVEGFCRIQKIHKDTFYEWVKKYPEFSDAFKQMKAAQYENLCINALEGRYNGVFAKFLAVNLTDLRDKQETDITTSGDKLEQKVIILPNNGRD